MNSVPPSQLPPDDVDDRYRRASALDPSRPSEAARRAVLAHAAQLAAQHAPRRPAANPTWWRPAMLGTLAAAALAALVSAPRWLAPHAPPAAETPAAAASERNSVPVPVAPPPAPAVEAPPALAKPRPSRQSSDNPLAADRARPQEQTGHAPAAPRVADNAAQSARSRGNAGSGEGDALTDSAGAPIATRLSEAASRATDRPSDADRPADLAAALRRAAEAGDLAVLKELLGKQTDIDSRDSSGRTALMLATLRGRADAVAALLAHGADPNAADARGTTPLQAAMAGSEPAVVKVLQRYGAR